MAINRKIVQEIRDKYNGNVILSLEERGFCVALRKDGTTIETEGRNVEEFFDLINTSSVSWVDYIIEDIKNDAPKIAKAIGFSDQLINTLLKSGRHGYEDLDREMGLLIPALIVKGFDVHTDPLIILMKENLVVTLHTTEIKRFFRLRRYAKIFMKKIKPQLSRPDKITLILIRIIDEHNSRNFDHLREIEDCSDKISEKLASVDTPREIIGKDIHCMKHALIVYLTGLWETVDVLNTLRYGDPELLTDDPKLLKRVAGLVEEVNNQIGLAEHMSEVLASGMEVMQSIYNNQLQILNNKLAMLVAYLTVIGTAVLVPNTLATALSNPAFQMGPQDSGWYITLLIISTVVSTAIAYWWVKKRGLLPNNPEGN